MEEELKEKIEEHLSTFPVRYKELEEMKLETKKYRERVITALFSSLFVLVGYGMWVGNIQTTINHFSDEQIIAEKDHAKYEQRLNSLEVNNSEIKTKLINIEATLQEIKISINKLR
jgi:cell division protein FtsB